MRSTRKDGPADLHDVLFHRSIRFRLHLLIGLMFICLLAVIWLVMQLVGHSLAMNQSRRFLEEKGHTAVAHFMEQIARAKALVRSMARTCAFLPAEPDLFKRILPEIMFSDSHLDLIAGGGFWPEPYAFNPLAERSSFFWMQDEAGRPRFLDSYNAPDSPGYHRREWYTPAKFIDRRHLYWSQVYEDPYSRERMVTCTAPVYRSERFVGVTTIDLRVDSMTRYLKQQFGSVNGYILALDRNNRFISFPHHFLEPGSRAISDQVFQGKIQDMNTLVAAAPGIRPVSEAVSNLDEALVEKSNTATSSGRTIAEAIAAESDEISLREARQIAGVMADPYALNSARHKVLIRHFQIETDPLLNVPAIAFLFHVPRTYWKIVIVTPESAALAIANTITVELMKWQIIIAIIGTFITTICLHRWIAGPLMTMTRNLQKLTDENGTALLHLPEVRQDELGQLAFWFNRRTDALQRVNDRLMESDQRFKLFMEQVPGMVSIKDAEGRYLYCNAACQRNFDTGGQLLGKTSIDVIAGPTGEWIAKADLDTLEAGLLSREETFNLADGSTRVYWVNRFVMPGAAEGRLMGCIAVDITDQKQAAWEKAKIEKALVQSQKMEAIGTLAGGIAHDFNNILGAILGYAELALLENTPGTATHRHLDRILKAGMRARDLVKQILTFSRQGDREIRPIRMKPIVKEALTLLRATLSATIEIRRRMNGAAAVLADPTGIHQVVMNLCTNAAFAMRDTGGVLEVELKDVEIDDAFAGRHGGVSPGKYMKLKVSDTGCGIPPSVVERIFDPFFTTKPQGEGTGLGLSVVHGIVQRWGGFVLVYSEPGQGATFNIFVPAADATGPAVEIAREIHLKGAERILVVDDEKTLADLYREQLAPLGYRVSTRTSPVEALELFRGSPDRFDMVITDMTMPQMTGVALASELSRIRPEIPILLVTGFSANLCTDQLEKAGVQAVVHKPILREEVACSIRRLLAPADAAD